MLISQFLPDAPPSRTNFPMRNVTMSGLGKASIIVEAGERLFPGPDGPRTPFVLDPRGKQRINIIQILMHSGMINSASSAAAQRDLADVLLKPPLANVDLLNWRGPPSSPRAAPARSTSTPPTPTSRPATGWPWPTAPERPSRSSLTEELVRRLGVTI